MRRLALLLGVLLLPMLAAASSWDQVTLFDWVYPGEANYELLKNAAAQSGHAGWLADRFNRGDKIPQASARELASRLWDDEKVDADTRAKLHEAFKDEPEQLGVPGEGLKKDRLDALSASLDRSSKKLDDVEGSLERNRYGKGSTPAVNMDLYSAYRLDAPSGLVGNDTHGYMAGGINITLMGTLDKANFTLALGGRYFYGADSAPKDFSTLSGITGGGVSFQMPLGEGGLEVHLGDVVDLYMSSLLQSGIFAMNRDAFFVDVLNPYRGPKTIKAMEMGYPAFTIQQQGLYIRRQGAEWYWPFSQTQFLYAPERQFHEFFRPHMTTIGLRLDEDFSGLLSFMDQTRVFYMVQQAGNDEDNLRQSNYLLTLPSGGPPYPIESSFAQSVGADLRLSTGTEFHGEGAVSHFQAKYLSKTAGETYDDTGWYGILSQPVGPLNVALELGAAGPNFLTGPQTPDRIQPGATLDTTGRSMFPGPAPINSLIWHTVIRDPTVLSNNSQRMVLKTELHLSFLSIGLYDGVMPQEVTTSPLVIMTPYIEGNASNGFGWFKIFGQDYTQVPPGFSYAAPGSIPSLGSTKYAQPAFNSKTEARAIYDQAGNSMNVHWQEFSQLGYRTAEFTTLLSQGGVGDHHVMEDGLKSVNFAGTNLIFDLASLFKRDLPLDLSIIGELRDVALTPAVPVLGAGNLFNQAVCIGFLNAALSPDFTVLFMGGYETWKTDHSLFPLNMQVQELGSGFDWKLDPIVSGLQFNLRATSMTYQDLNIAARELSLWTLSVGSTLSY